jgi:hypothetical protein
VVILEHYFSSISFSAVREAFRNALCRERSTELDSNTPTGNKIFGCNKCSLSDKTAEITVVPFQDVHQLQQRDTAARIQYCHWFRRFA